LKAKNPQVFHQYEEIKKSNGNPQELLKQATNNYTPEQMEQFKKFVNGFGITDEQLNQYGINVTQH